MNNLLTMVTYDTNDADYASDYILLENTTENIELIERIRSAVMNYPGKGHNWCADDGWGRDEDVYTKYKDVLTEKDLDNFIDMFFLPNAHTIVKIELFIVERLINYAESVSCSYSI